MLTVSRLPDDWKACCLREREVVRMNGDGSNSLHRSQVIHVKREGVDYEEETDLGEAARFNHEQMALVAGGLTPVGRMREYAAVLRDEKPYAEQAGLEGPSKGDLQEMWGQYVEETWNQASHRSVVGAALRRERT